MIVGGMTAEYYFTYWDGLAEYYGNHVNVVQHHTWSLDDALPYIKYIPGYMLWRNPGGNWPVVLSCVSDLAPVMVLFALWRKAGPCRSLAIAGAFIYYVGYAANLLLWNDPNYFSPENSPPGLASGARGNVAQLDRGVHRRDRSFSQNKVGLARALGIRSCARLGGCLDLDIDAPWRRGAQSLRRWSASSANLDQPV